MHRLIWILVLVGLGLWVPIPRALAETAVSCHCFKDRSYQPKDRFAADDYILATSFNSLLARSFEIPKKRIVMLKMKKGVAQTDLLVGLQIARLSGLDLENLLELCRQKQPWSKILADLALPESQKREVFMKILALGVSTKRAAAVVADQLLVRFYQAPPSLIQKFRTTGLDEKEINLILILARTGKLDPETLVACHGAGQSMSEIAHGLGIEPAMAGELVMGYGAE